MILELIVIELICESQLYQCLATIVSNHFM
jgi:hypothetical protein